MKRYAIIKSADSREQLERYLPGNYRIVFEYVSADDGFDSGKTRFVIEGRDVAGWTLDDYVKPRLASGLIFAVEIDLSHPIMKEVPA